MLEEKKIPLKCCNFRGFFKEIKFFKYLFRTLLGARVTEYLLEKSRIVTHAPEERNYHVFYELLAGLPEDQRLKYGLMSAEKYFYLNQGWKSQR
jgi:myosin-15